MRILVWRLLNHLRDGQWHLQPPRGVGPRTVEFCFSRRWVETKRETISRERDIHTFFMPLRITDYGLSAYRAERSQMLRRKRGLRAERSA